MFLMLRQQILIVVDSRHSLLRAKIMRKDAGCYITALIGRNSHEEVGIIGSCALECRNLCRVTDNGLQIEKRLHVAEFLLTLVEQYHILVLRRKHLCQVGSNRTGTYYDYSHCLLPLKSSIASRSDSLSIPHIR